MKKKRIIWIKTPHTCSPSQFAHSFYWHEFCQFILNKLVPNHIYDDISLCAVYRSLPEIYGHIHL